MRIFKTLKVKNHPLFPEQSFDLGRKGISIILGANRNVGESGGTNFVGKSAFFGSAFELLTLEPAQGSAADRAKGSWIGISGDVDGKKLAVSRDLSKTEKIRVKVNGNDLDIVKLPDAKKRVRDLFGYTADEVSTMIYLNALQSHPLIDGSTADRQNFFSRFFHLQSLDHYRKLFKTELDRITSDEIRYEEVLKQSSEIRALAKEDLESLQEEYHKRSKQAEILLSRIEKAESVLGHLQTLRTNKAGKLLCKELQITLASDAEERITNHKAALTKWRACLRDWEAYEESQEFLKDSRERLERALESYEETTGDKVSSLEETTEELENCKKTYAKESDSFDQITEYLQEERDRVKELEKRKARLRQDISDLEQDIEALSKKSDVCPTCGGPFHNKEVGKRLAESNTLIAKYRKRLSVLEADDGAEEFASLEKKYQTKAQEKFAKMERLKIRIDSLSHVQKCFIALNTSGIEKPPKTKSYAEDKIGALTEDLENLSHCLGYLEAKEKLKNIDPSVLEDAESLSVLRQKYLESNTRALQAETKMEGVQAAKEKYRELVQRSRELKESISEKEVYLVLYQSMQKNAVPSMLIQSIAEQLESKVNQYAASLMPESYIFKFELDTQFRILATHRFKDGKESTCDVRMFSGAEKRFFSLVLAISLLSFLPASRRCNFMILDEPTATMGPDSVDHFVKFLPILNKVVPHLIVITPLDPSAYSGLENTKVFTVVKENGSSRIVEGRVSPESRARKAVK